jgi:hypothetical protein
MRVMLVEMLLDDPEVASVRAEKKSGIAPTQGMAPSSMSKPMLPAIRVTCHFDMPRLRASQAM